MSCCNECEQSGGNCNQGLGMLGGMLPAGSNVTVTITAQVDWSFWGGGSLSQSISDEVEGCLYQSGAFNSVAIKFNGTFYSNNVTLEITVNTVYDHADVEDVGSWIAGIIQYCAVSLNYKSRSAAYSPNAVSTVSPGNIPNPPKQDGCPPGYYNASYLAWIGVLDCQPLPSQDAVNNDGSDRCNFSRQSWGDYLACQLGIKPSQAVIVGVIGALAGVVLISKIAK